MGPLGAVFTPPDLAREAADTLARRVAADGPLRVLDPACGDGALLAALLEPLAPAERRALARAGLFGIELDAEHAERARERLRRLAGLPRGTELDEHVVCADALEAAWPAGTHVLANPPWASYSGRHAVEPARGRRGDRSRGWPSLHGAFLERIARHVAREGTRAAVLLPAQVTELEGYAPLRNAVTSVARLAAPPRELGEGRFAGVVSPSTLLELEPAGDDAVASDAPWRAADPSAGRLRAALERFPRLPPRTFADPGVHTGNAASLLVHDAPCGHEAPCAPLRVGRDLAAFALGAPSRRLRTDLAPTPDRRFRVAPSERYASFPVLLRQTADRPIAALHVAPTFFRNSLLAAREVDGLDPAFVVAVLNGPVAAAWHRTQWRDARQRAFPQVKVAHLRSLPFPLVARDERPALHDELATRTRELLLLEGEAFERAREALERRTADAYALSPDVLELALSAASRDRPRPGATNRPPRSAR